MQTFYVNELKLLDIPYNFLIGGDGLVYEGRGFFHQGEIARIDNINDYDNSGLIFAFIGNFSSRPPFENQTNTFDNFIRQSINRDLIANNFIMLSQSQLLAETHLDSLTEALEETFDFFHRRKNHYQKS